MEKIQETAEIRAEQNYQKFRTTKQETLRLQAALAGFFEEEKAGITAERKGTGGRASFGGDPADACKSRKVWI